MNHFAIAVRRDTLVPVHYLLAECGVRYWEDAKVNGEVDDDGSRIPCRDPAPNDSLGGGTWRPLIELATGKIIGWPAGTTADIHYKVCDDGRYSLLSQDAKTVVKKIDGYVPKMMSPGGAGYGDYVIMKVGADGTIDGWSVSLAEFCDHT